MKNIILPVFFVIFSCIAGPAQQPFRIDNKGIGWEAGKDGYRCIDLPKSNDHGALPDEFGQLADFSIFNIPFHINAETAGLFSTSKEGTENISLSTPNGTTEILFVMVADFPIEEIARSWELLTPVQLLAEPERALVQLLYTDGDTEDMIPVNADFHCYGITHGRALYSVTAKKGKYISGMTFSDKMKNASFHIVAATANEKLFPKIALPESPHIWYEASKKVPVSDARFLFATTRGFSWSRIESAMLPETINLYQQPVFMVVANNGSIPSTKWELINSRAHGDTLHYTIVYRKDGLSLEALLTAIQPRGQEIVLSVAVTNRAETPVKAQLVFPIISNLTIGPASNTWYAYARNGLIVNQRNCSYRDYLGSEKPLQFDGIFNPAAGVGIGIFPRDTTDTFRWYNFSKNNDGVQYAIEYTPVTKSKGESWKGIPVALAVIPGD